MPANETDDLQISGDTQELLSYKDLAHAVLEKLWLVILCVVVAMFLGGAYIKRTPPTFRSIATLQVEPQDLNVMAVQQAQPMDYYNQELRNTFVENIRSQSFLIHVAKAGDLANDPNFLPPAKDGHKRSDEEIAGYLTGMVTASIRQNTRLIDISVEHTNPATAQKIADLVANEFIVQNIERGTSATKTAQMILLAQVNEQKDKVTRAEQEIQKYRETHATVALDDGQNIILEKLKDLNGRVTALRSNKIMIDADLVQMDKLRNNPDALLLLPSVANYASILAIKHQITLAESDLATMRLRYGERHPKMIQARSRIADYNKSIRDIALRMPELLKSEDEKISSELVKMESALTTQESAELSLDSLQIPYSSLKRQLQTDQVLYEALLKRVSDAGLEAGLQKDEARINAVHVSQEANLPGGPFKPNVQKILIISFFTGITVALGLVYLLHLADTSLKTIDQVEKVTGLAVLGGIPMVKTKKKKRMVVTEAFLDENSSVAESFRSLRAALSLIMARPGDSTGVSMLCTSASPGEGKTFCCTNFAAVLARQGLKTLLVDADLRRPILHDVLLKLKQSPPGFSEFLEGKMHPFDLIQPTGIPGLNVLPAGTVLDRPAELLANGGELLTYFEEEMRKYFDWVIYDTAPINILADTSLLIPYVRSTVIVIQACRTPRGAVVRALEAIQRAGGDIAGAAFNKVPPSPTGYYYYGYRYYHQKYGNRAYSRSSHGNGNGESELSATTSSNGSRKENRNRKTEEG